MNIESRINKHSKTNLPIMQIQNKNYKAATMHNKYT